MNRPTLKFPERLQALRDAAPELVAILETGHESEWYAFVTLDDMTEKTASVAATETLLQSSDRGLVMRIVAGGRNFETATNILDLESLKELANKLRATVEAETFHRDAPVYTPLTWADEDRASLDPLMSAQLGENLSASTQVHFGTPYEISPAETTLAGMVERCREIRAGIFDKDPAPDGKKLSTAVTIRRQTIRTKIFVDRHKNMSQCLLSSMSYAYGVSPQGRIARYIQGGLGGFETAIFTDEDIDYTAKTPHKLDAAKRLDAGRYALITGPDITGVIAHEAFGHTQEGDTRRLGRSCATALERDETSVGNEQANIYNNAAVFSMDGENWGSNGSHFFDDEGQLARPQKILDRGIVKQAMNDLISALLGDANGTSPRQSNGKRESWRNPIMARQTNTYFTAGDKTLEEMIGMVEYGFLAEFAHGGMEDPKGMGLTAGADYLQEIKDGKLTGEIFLGPKGGHIELSDPVPRILNGILAKSKVDDNCIPLNKWGGCGKYHKESVAAGCGGPWILWKDINCG